MDSLDSKIARLQDLLRQAYAIANEIGYIPNVREPNNRSVVEHHENLALLAEIPKPGPLVPVEFDTPRIPPAPELDE